MWMSYSRFSLILLEDCSFPTYSCTHQSDSQFFLMWSLIKSNLDYIHACYLQKIE